MTMITINKNIINIENIKSELNKNWIFIGNQIIPKKQLDFVVIDYFDLVKTGY